MNTLTSANSRIGGVAAVLAVVGMGAIAAGAFEGRAGPVETAPALSCPNPDRVLLPRSAAGQLFDPALTPTQIANTHVLKSVGWTNSNFNALGTTERFVTGSDPAVTEVDIHDMGMHRIGVVVVTKTDTGWALTGTYECATPTAAS